MPPGSPKKSGQGPGVGVGTPGNSLRGCAARFSKKVGTKARGGGGYSWEFFEGMCRPVLQKSRDKGPGWGWVLLGIL